MGIFYKDNMKNNINKIKKRDIDKEEYERNEKESKRNKIILYYIPLICIIILAIIYIGTNNKYILIPFAIFFLIFLFGMDSNSRTCEKCKKWNSIVWIKSNIEVKDKIITKKGITGKEKSKKQKERIDRNTGKCTNCGNEVSKEKIKKIYPVSEKQMTVIGTGYNSEVFKKTGIKLSRKDGKIRMIFAGKITQKKGVKSLLRALNLLDYEKEKIQLILAGGAGNLVEYEEIKELADGCRYPVVFAGCVTQSRLAELYNDCDIFVLPSMYEGLPLTVIESLACGDRVVMTKLEGIAEWLADMVPDADIRYVLPPGMKGTDEPLEEELPAFESRLAEALREAIEEKDTKECDVSRISWQKIAREVIR